MTSSSDIDAILARYPKARPPLPPAYAAVHEREYKLNREGGSLLTKMSSGLESWMHRRVAAGPAGDVLEIGAGTLNQLRHEPVNAGYDVIEPFEALYRGSPELQRVRSVYADIAQVPAERRYRRVTSVAVLEHLDDLPAIVARSGQLLDAEGVFQAGIPSEGGLAWTLAWKTTTGIAYWLRNRLDYSVLMHHEHLNTAAEIEAVVGHFFGDVRVARYLLPTRHLSFYTYLEARAPRLEQIAAFLGRR